MKEKLRWSMDVTNEDDVNALKLLGKTIFSNKTELIRAALYLMIYIVKELSKGNDLYFINPKGDKVKLAFPYLLEKENE